MNLARSGAPIAGGNRSAPQVRHWPAAQSPQSTVCPQLFVTVPQMPAQVVALADMANIAGVRWDFFESRKRLDEYICWINTEAPTSKVISLAHG